MKIDKRIDEICDERPNGAWFVYLKPGFSYDGQHCFGEDRKKDIARTMKFVKPCDCESCRELKSGGAR